MADALSKDLSKADRLKLNMPIRLETNDSESQRRIILDESSASAVLFNRVSYHLESGNLVIYALIDMYPTPKYLTKFVQEPKLKNPFDKTNEIYRKLFIFSKQFITPENIKDSLAEGAINIAKQIAADLNHPI